MGSKGAKKPSDKTLEKAGGPWQPLNDPLKRQIQQITNVTSQPYQYGPDRVVGLDPGQQWAIDRGKQIATSGEGVPGLYGAYGNVERLASGGLSGAGTGTLNNYAANGVGRGAGAAYMDKVATRGVTNPAYANLEAIMTQADKGSPIADKLERIDKYAAAGSGGIDYLQDVAGGKYLGKNPYIDKLVSDVETDARNSLLPALEGRMAQAGRLGSNAETMGQGEIARKLAQTSNDIRYTDYNNERGFQQQAGLALPGAYGQEINNRLATVGAQGDDYYRSLDERLKAAQAVGSDVYQRANMQMDAAQIANNDYRSMINQNLDAAQAANTDQRAFQQQSLQAASQLPGQYQSLYAPAEQAMKWGSAQQVQNQAIRDDQVNRFNFNQEEPYNQLKRRLDLFSGVAGMTNPATAGNAYMNAAMGPSREQVMMGNATSLLGGAAKVGAMFL